MSNVGKTIKKVADKAVDTVTAPFKAVKNAFTPPAPPTQMGPQIIQVPAPTTEEMSRNKRMPGPQDPDVIAAGRRQRANALRRKGRLSTILTDQTGGKVDKLG